MLLTHLWVDALCILQDDGVVTEYRDGRVKDHPYSKIMQIKIMGDIYWNAEFTLVARDGESARSGLPGIQPWSRPLRCVQLDPDCAVYAETFERTPHGSSNWSSRGWTYQEGALSKRLIYFCDTTIWFQCLRHCVGEHTGDGIHRAKKTRRERLNPEWSDQNAEAINPFHEFRKTIELKATGLGMEVYAKMVEQYTTWSLTYPDDRLGAFIGVASRLAEKTMDQIEIFGIPFLYLRFAIMWCDGPGNRLEGREYLLVTTRLGKFPSWTWTGWSIPISYHFALTAWNAYGLEFENHTRGRFDALPPRGEVRNRVWPGLVRRKGRHAPPNSLLDDDITFKGIEVAKTGRLIVGSDRESAFSFPHYHELIFDAKICGFLLSHIPVCLQNTVLVGMMKAVKLAPKEPPSPFTGLHHWFKTSINSLDDEMVIVMLVYAPHGHEPPFYGSISTGTRLAVGVVMADVWKSLRPKVTDI
ncbi:hypothetical protein K458DRAFT_158602 [Lentithecium fluviatile CBS 122367]|uniref:Heterokaryon incompatibility domain-containing protein n=1 Tax=Lentithecium fluviatile CBS 122367 TaxID=1168545 RepID=A0A6G1IHB6_9PLEO|nr:hypothetical protein K458DRAFT_158602 [Lentithecium fluviatile CBS 122367]